ncbi:hypothetical protein [Faecalispora jeddahensis]|uniref:hypothetical protein n=1 Tax=Faecalispora jeddahensis TaxID=1414721 RepID=UPI001FAD0775|nr:hypothetical protein [Faecalispora jeddahensis]
MMDLPGLLYYQNGGVYKGSGGNGRVRYKIEPVDDKLTVQVWFGPYCYEKSEMEDRAEFALSDVGRSEMMDWLSNKIEGMRK